MSPSPHDPTPSINPVDALIASYVQAVEAGRVPNRRELLQQNPDHAETLLAFFADFDRMDRVASPLRMSHEADETPSLDPNSPTQLPTIRYFGDYELLEEIARGGMGVVYKARQASLNRLVALKMILAGTFASPREVARFQAEAEAAANLDHPHIVPVYEVGEHKGQQYFSMKFIEGGSLATHPRSDLRSEVLGLITIARAVHHAHQHGVLHRDLKPSNVLVDPKGDRHVTDFGLAKRLADIDRSLTEAGQILGTPRYMSPEQAAGRKDLTVAADIYALGVILYERLTGRTPFEGTTAIDLLRQVRESEPPRPSSIQPGLDRDLETIVLKCLDKDPTRRYLTAEDLNQDLTRWQEGRPINARPVGQSERFVRWCRRNPVVAGLSASVAVALLLLAVVSSFFAYQQRQARIRAEGAEEATEKTFARSLARPFDPRGDQDGHEALSSPETSALWELAQLQDQPLALRFLEESTRDPIPLGQLRARSEPALIAAVGLDPARRDRAASLLRERLRDPKLSTGDKVEIATIALELQDQPGETLDECVRTIIEARQSKSEVRLAPAWQAHVSRASQRLEPMAASRILVDEFDQQTIAYPGLTKDIAGLFDRLNRPDAEKFRKTMVGQMVLKQFALEPDFDSRLSSAECLAILQPCIEIARRPGDPKYNDALRMLGNLIPRLDAADTARMLDLLVDQGLDPFILVSLDEYVLQPFGRLNSIDAERIAVKLLNQINATLENTKESNYSNLLGRLLVSIGTSPNMLDRQRQTGWLPQFQTLNQAIARLERIEDRASLDWGLGPLADRLGPQEAAKICVPVAENLVAGLDQDIDASSEFSLINSLAAMSLRIPPEQARKVIRLLAIRAEKVRIGAGSPGEFQSLLSNLSQEDARRAARVMVLTLGGEEDTKVRWSLGAGLCLVAEQMKPEEAVEICGPVAKQMVESFLLMRSYGSYLLSGLGIVLSRLPEGQRRDLIQSLLDTPENAKDREYLLYDVLVASVGKEDSREATRVAGILGSKLAKEPDVGWRSSLVGKLGALADRASGSELKAILVSGMEKETHPGVRMAIIQTLITLVGRVPASELAAVLGGALERGTVSFGYDFYGYMKVRDSLLALIHQMDPTEAAVFSGRMVRWLSRSVEAKETYGLSFSQTIDVAKFSERIPREEAEPLCAEIITRVLKARTPEYEDSRGSDAIDDRVLALLAEIPQETAHAVARELLNRIFRDGEVVVTWNKEDLGGMLDLSSHTRFGMGGPGGPGMGMGMDGKVPPRPIIFTSLQALLIDNSRSQRAIRPPSPPTAPPSPAVGSKTVPSAAAGPPYPCRLTTQELVDLLKMPTCFGDARRLILEHLGNRYGRKFANHWEFVRFAQGQKLDLDFATPPRRPDPKGSMRRMLDAIEDVSRR